VIILDTNVISALMQTEPDPKVAGWLNEQAAESIWTTSITVFEVRFGLEILAPGARRKRLTAGFESLIIEDLAGRVLDLDASVANEAAVLSARLRGRGRPIEIRDAMICGIALARRAHVATRNVRHFESSSVPLVDPWS